jgi:NTE family protein
MSEPQGVAEQNPDSSKPRPQDPAGNGGKALVLSGGGIKGAYQAGAICEVIKQGFHPTVIYGISVGSINGGMLTSYAGEQIRDGRKLDFLAAAERVENYWRHSITDFKKLGHDRSKLVLIWEVLVGNFKGMINVDGAIGIIRKEIQKENLQAAADQGVAFFAGTIDLTEGRYLNAPGTDPEIVEYVIASAMEPIVMPMHIIRIGDRENYWLDGGVHNVAPIGEAINRGCSEIVCIACQPDTLGRASFQGRLAALGERISDVVIQRLLDADIAQALEINKWVDRLAKEGQRSGVDHEFLNRFKKIDLRLIRPKKDPNVDLLTFTKNDIERMIKMGHEDAAAEMGAHPRSRTPQSKVGQRAN